MTTDQAHNPTPPSAPEPTPHPDPTYGYGTPWATPTWPPRATVSDQTVATAAPSGSGGLFARWSTRTRVLAGVGVAAAIVLIGVAAHAMAAPKPINITGTFTLTDTPVFGLDSSIDTTSDGCEGTGGYNDLHQGTPVTVTDQTGAIVALGSLTSGVPSGDSCMFVFGVSNVPAGKGFYGVAVSHRGSVQYTEQQLRDGVSLSVGS